MFYADYHVHTSFSGDSNAPMEDIVRHAIKIGLKEIALTDHVDPDYPTPEEDFLIDYDEYLVKFSEVKEKYKNHINIILGVEIGMQTHIRDEIKQFIDKYPFDFIIGSTHVADRLDFHNGDFFRGKEQNNAYLRYFEALLENIKLYDEFDVCGHLDFIIRYGGYELKKLSYEDYSDIIDSILKTLIEKGQGIEINTSGYRYNLEQTHPQLSILNRYKKLGGEIVTVGSDAHFSEHICSHFTEAYEMLKSAGFDKITLYEKRKPRFFRIP